MARKFNAHFSVISATTAAEPGSPAEDDTYIVPASATGTNWAGQDGSIAMYIKAAWVFMAPSEGWRFWVSDADKVVVYDGASWVDLSAGGGASAFTDLTDTPGSLGSAGQILQVNTGGTALEFVDNTGGGGGGGSTTAPLTNQVAVLDLSVKTLATGDEYDIPAATLALYHKLELRFSRATSASKTIVLQVSSDDLTTIEASTTAYYNSELNRFGDNDFLTGQPGLVLCSGGATQSSVMEVVGFNDAAVKTMVIGENTGAGNYASRISEKVTATLDNSLRLVTVDGVGYTGGTLEIIGYYKEVTVATSEAAPAVPAVVRDSLVTWRDGTTTTAPFPAGAVAGDTCVIVASGAWSPTIPSGWTSVASVTGADQQGKAFTRVLTDADITAGSVSVTWSGSFEHTYSAVAFVGTHTIRYGEVFQDAGAATTPSHVITNSDTTDKMILVGAARASSITITSDTGSLLDSAGGVSASAAIYGHDPVADGGLTVGWTFSGTPNGYTLWAFSAQEIPAIVDGIVVGDAITASQDVTDALLVGDLWQDVDPSGGDITLTTQIGTIGNQPVTIENVDTTNNVIFAQGASTTINSLNGLTLPPGGVAVLMPKGSGVYRLIGDLTT